MSETPVLAVKHVRKVPRHKKGTSLKAVFQNLMRDLRVWWRTSHV